MSKKLSLQELPQEIITNILSRLPAKSLLQYKSVSKLWLSLVSSPHFAKLHLHQMKTNNTVARRIFSPELWSFNPKECVDDMGDYNHQAVTLTRHNLPIREILFHLPFNMVDSCNGLICIARDGQYKHYAVVNPTTGQFRKIPKLDSSHYGFNFCGFGYDSQIDDYKIVGVVVLWSFVEARIEILNEVRIEVFSLKSNSWRTTIQDQNFTGVPETRGVFLNGILHWLRRRNNVGETQLKCEIIRFDLVEGRFLDVMPLPSPLDHSTWGKSLIVLDECLCVYTPWDAIDSPVYSEAWKMMNYGVQNSWTRIYHFSDDRLPNCEVSLHLSYMSKNGCLWFVEDGFGMIVYNPKNKGIDSVQFSVDNIYWGYNSVYVESLISPNVAE